MERLYVKNVKRKKLGDIIKKQASVAWVVGWVEARPDGGFGYGLSRIKGTLPFFTKFEIKLWHNTALYVTASPQLRLAVMLATKD